MTTAAYYFRRCLGLPIRANGRPLLEFKPLRYYKLPGVRFLQWRQRYLVVSLPPLLSWNEHREEWLREYPDPLEGRDKKIDEHDVHLTLSAELFANCDHTRNVISNFIQMRNTSTSIIVEGALIHDRE